MKRPSDGGSKGSETEGFERPSGEADEADEEDEARAERTRDADRTRDAASARREATRAEVERELGPLEGDADASLAEALEALEAAAADAEAAAAEFGLETDGVGGGAVGETGSEGGWSSGEEDEGAPGGA